MAPKRSLSTQPAASTKKAMRKMKSKKREKHADFTTDDKMNIAWAVIYLGPRYTQSHGRKRNNTELPIGSHAMFRRIKTLLSYQHRPNSIMKCFRKWRLENMEEWEAMKEEAEANGEGYFGDWVQLEEDLIERGELDDNRLRVKDVPIGDDLSVGSSDQQAEKEDREPSEKSFAPQEEAEVGDGQTAYIYFETVEPDAQPEYGEDGEHRVDYVVEDANSDQDDVHGGGSRQAWCPRRRQRSPDRAQRIPLPRPGDVCAAGDAAAVGSKSRWPCRHSLPPLWGQSTREKAVST